MAIPGISDVIGTASTAIQGTVRSVSGEGSTFARVAGQVAQRTTNAGAQVVSGVVSAGVGAIDRALGGAENRIALENAAFGQGGVLGKVRQTVDPAGRIAGIIGGNPLAALSTGGGWGRLSTHLLGRMYACDSKGVENMAEGFILAPATDGTMEASFNWQSPFENTGPETKAPALMAMIQTGQLGDVAAALQSVVGGGSDSLLGKSAEQLKQVAKDLEGKTGITKLNSRQVFSGMPPIKLNMTLHLRAFQNAKAEVQEPYERLLRWALPQELAQDRVTNAVNTNSQEGAFVRTMFPSRAPMLVGFTHARQRYAPMVIESVMTPIDGPLGADGIPIYRSVQITLATLTALDRNDVKNLFLRG